MIVEKRIHNLYRMEEKLREKSSVELPELPKLFGKYQYIYKSDKGKISLIELIDPVTMMFNNDRPVWEIYSLKGDLFEDVERFDTHEEAVAKCREYLE